MTGKHRVERTLEHLHTDVAKLTPEKAAIMSHEIVEAWQAAQPGLGQLRRDCLRRAIEHDGWTQADLAALLGVSRQRIHQLMNDPTTVRGPRKTTHITKEQTK